MFPYPDTHTGPYYDFGVTALWPSLMLMTKRDWRGQHNLGGPADGAVIAPNHMTWFDPLAIAHYMNDSGRPPRFLAKDKLFEMPLVGRVLRGTDQIRVRRESADAGAAVGSAVRAVQDGEAVVVYPEGTLTRDPDLWPMTGKTGAARIALGADAPLVPLAQWGAHELLGPYAKTIHPFPRKTMHLIAGDPVDLDDLRGAPITESVLADATIRLMDAITDLVAELRDEEPPAERWDRRRGERVEIERGQVAERVRAERRSSR